VHRSELLAERDERRRHRRRGGHPDDDLADVAAEGTRCRVASDQRRRQEAREAYDFWIPLDLQFLQTVSDLANYARMLFVVPFNTQSDSGYLTWSTGTPLEGEGGANTPAEVFSAVQSTAITNAAAAVYTGIAKGYHDIIVPSDTVAPSPPAFVSASRSSPSTAVVSWSPSTDNIGVAGYHILRNGSRVGDVFQPPYQDSGLSPSGSYTYTVQAFDLAGNVSAAAGIGQSSRHRAVRH
jgi:hypothetical protein